MITFNDQQYKLLDGETVLECLIRNKIDYPHSCKSGVCQSCMMRAVEGTPSQEAQRELKPPLQKQNMFLACQWRPTEPIVIQEPNFAQITQQATVVDKSYLNHKIIRLRLKLNSNFEAFAGQYLFLYNPENISRCYSIAIIDDTNPSDTQLELHIALHNGLISSWVEHTLQLEDTVRIGGPAGYCYYVKEQDTDFNILLAGAGTGLAPLYGIAEEALKQGHKGEIHLFHGVVTADDIYYDKELQALKEKYPNFDCQISVLKGTPSQGHLSGHLVENVLSHLKSFQAKRTYLCGDPDLVNTLKKKVFLSGIASKQIYSDPFIHQEKNL